MSTNYLMQQKVVDAIDGFREFGFEIQINIGDGGTHIDLVRGLEKYPRLCPSWLPTRLENYKEAMRAEVDAAAKACREVNATGGYADMFVDGGRFQQGIVCTSKNISDRTKMVCHTAEQFIQAARLMLGALEMKR